jgi:hypothetical protein
MIRNLASPFVKSGSIVLGIYTGISIINQIEKTTNNLVPEEIKNSSVPEENKNNSIKFKFFTSN